MAVDKWFGPTASSSQRPRVPLGAPWSWGKKKDGTMRFCARPAWPQRLHEAERRHRCRESDEHSQTGLHGAKWFYVYRSAVWLLAGGAHEQDREKLAFAAPSPRGVYVFKVMPFGARGAPQAFQARRNLWLAGVIPSFRGVYIDDILIFSSTFDEHLRHVAAVLDRLAAFRLVAKVSKARFAATSLPFLGHVVGEGGIRPTRCWWRRCARRSRRATSRRCSRFLGLCGYYQQFVQDYAKIVEPIRRLRGR